jgi:hypothetical protein
VFFPEYDPLAGTLHYAAWALPGTASSDPGWRIARLTWDGPGLHLTTVEWADGDDHLDNVLDDRASLTYTANPALSLFEADTIDLTPIGTFPGTTFTVGFPLGDRDTPWLDSTPMKRVGTLTGGNQYIVSGDTFVTNDPVQASSWFFVRVRMG